MKIELRKFNFGDYLRFLFLTLDRQYSQELEDSFFGYLFRGLKSLFEKNVQKFAILADKRFAGNVGLWINKNKDWEIGYLVLREYRNKGIATKAVRMVLNFGFRDLGLDKIIATTDFNNIASQKILKKLGFKIIKENKKEKEFIWEKRK